MPCRAPSARPADPDRSPVGLVLFTSQPSAAATTHGEVKVMAKHYLKYALSTLSAAMFAHMA